MDEKNGTVNGENVPSESGNSVETVLDETGGGGESNDGGETMGENAESDTENGDDESPEASIDETDGGGKADKIRLVYIGPSLTYEKLRTAQILSGTEAEIADFMRPITEKYPEAVHLLVTPEKLHEAMRKVESKSSVLRKYYEDMLAKSRDVRKG